MILADDKIRFLDKVYALIEFILTMNTIIFFKHKFTLACVIFH